MKLILAIITTAAVGTLSALVIDKLGFHGYYAGYSVGLIVGITGMATQEIFKVK